MGWFRLGPLYTQVLCWWLGKPTIPLIRTIAPWTNKTTVWCKQIQALFTPIIRTLSRHDLKLVEWNAQNTCKGSGFRSKYG
jgi:hypothetical protein